MVDNHDVMTDADFEEALNLLQTDDYNEVSDLLKVMNESRIISWEDAEKIMCDLSNEPIKSSLPQQTRPTEPDNNTDVDLSIRRLLKNDPKLIEINLNNMKRTPIPQIKRILEAMRENTYLEKISLANMGLYDMDVAPLVNVLEENDSLRSINLETNYLSGEFFARLLRAALKNQTLEEFKGVNQGIAFSTTAEQEIINAVFENRRLIKVSINLRLPEGRHKIEQTTIRNLEIRRLLRRQAALEARAAAEAAGKKEDTLVGVNLGEQNLTNIKTEQTYLKKQKNLNTLEKKNKLHVKFNDLAKTQLPVLASFEKRRAQVLNEAKKEKLELIESPKTMAPMILGSTATAELSSVTTKKLSPEKLSARQLSFGKHILSRQNSSFDNENENETTSISQILKPIKHIGKQNILLPITDTNSESKTAFIPEAPLGKASAMAKKFAAAEATAKETANKSVLRRPSESANVPMKKIIKVQGNAIVPLIADSSVKHNSETKTIKNKKNNEKLIQNSIMENINMNEYSKN